MKEIPRHSQSLVFQNPDSKVDFHWYNGSSYRHMHLDYYELIVIIDGEFSHEFLGNTLTLTRGDAVLIKPKHYHTQLSDQKNSLLANFSLTVDCFKSITEQYDKNIYKNLKANSGTPVKLTESELEFLVSALNKAYSFGKNGDASVDFYYVSLFHWLLGVMNLKYSPENSADSAYPDWLKTFLPKLNSPEVFCLPLQEIYKASGYSQSRFINLFNKYMNTSPIKYITELRINYAKQLLLKTNFNVLEICNILNYSSLSYFITLFKRQTGYTPTEFRHEFYINVDDRLK